MKLIEFCGYLINPTHIQYIIRYKKKDSYSYNVYISILEVKLLDQKIEKSYESAEERDEEYNRLLSELREV